VINENRLFTWIIILVITSACLGIENQVWWTIFDMKNSVVTFDEFIAVEIMGGYVNVIWLTIVSSKIRDPTITIHIVRKVTNIGERVEFCSFTAVLIVEFSIAANQKLSASDRMRSDVISWTVPVTLDASFCDHV
jgi:hypothetical protein